MTRSLATMLFVLLAATAGAQADHLQCFKIKDAIAKATYTVNLAPTDARFPVATGCAVRLPAKLLCIDVVQTIVPPPTPPGAGPGNPAQKYLCYKVKCPKATPTATIQDQFGTHQVTVKGTSLLCAPAPTSSSTTTTTTSTTTTSSGCASAADCPPSNSPCQGATCTAGVCGTTPLPRGSACVDPNLNGGTGFCDSDGNCVQCAADVGCPSSGNQCQQAVCTISGTCSTVFLASGTPCNQNGGTTCDGAGHCV
jgi:hypothetical protein